MKRRNRRRNKKKAIIILITVICIAMVVYKEVDIKGTENTISGSFQNDSEILLVNDNSLLHESYMPDNLTVPKIKFVENAEAEEKQLDEEVAKQIEKLFASAKKEDIIYIGTSGYRSYESQKKIYNREVRKNGKRAAKDYVAQPGSSEHQTGLCIDVTNEIKWFDESTIEAQWLANNAHEFGFIIRYPKGKENITGKKYEPWHIRYVGLDVAKEIYYSKLTLEEYLMK